MTKSLVPFTRFPNELYDNILLSRSSLTLHQAFVLLAIIRLTYGYGKETAEIPAAKISRMIGLPLTHVYKARAELIASGIIKEVGKTIGVNNDLSTWLIKNTAESKTDSVSRPAVTAKPTRKGSKKTGKTTPYVETTETDSVSSKDISVGQILSQEKTDSVSKTKTDSVLTDHPHQAGEQTAATKNPSENQSVSPETAENSEPDSISYINNLYLLSLKKNLKIDDDRYLLKKAANAVQESSSSKNFLEKDKLPKAAQALLDVWNAAFPDRKIPSLIPTPRFALLTEVTEFLQSVAGTEPWPESADIQHLEWWLEDVLEYAKQQPYTSKASFDWIFQPQYLTRLVEGAYAPRCQ